MQLQLVLRSRSSNNESSGELGFSLHLIIPFALVRRWVVICPSVASISSNSFAAREQRFSTQTPHLNATKYSDWIFEILLGGRATGSSVSHCLKINFQVLDVQMSPLEIEFDMWSVSLEKLIHTPEVYVLVTSGPGRQSHHRTWPMAS